ncbi:TPA: hypothetical protein U2J34_000264 [Enterobacter hormaechei]|nr:hypothetical protein [Enterobacter hormaechei]HEM7459987.1 hypothetical protein [Enterobacter hormaechei]
MTTENQHSAPDYAGAHRGMFWGVVKAAISTRQTLYLCDRHYTTKAFLPHQRVTTEGKAMEFKKGDVVTWSSQAAGSWKTKTGVITEVWEYKKQTRYTVKVDPKEGSTAKPKFYYPRTSALQKVS